MNCLRSLPFCNTPSAAASPLQLRRRKGSKASSSGGGGVGSKEGSKAKPTVIAPVRDQVYGDGPQTPAQKAENSVVALLATLFFVILLEGIFLAGSVRSLAWGGAWSGWWRWGVLGLWQRGGWTARFLSESAGCFAGDVVERCRVGCGLPPAAPHPTRTTPRSLGPRAS